MPSPHPPVTRVDRVDRGLDHLVELGRPIVAMKGAEMSFLLWLFGRKQTAEEKLVNRIAERFAAGVLDALAHNPLGQIGGDSRVGFPRPTWDVDGKTIAITPEMREKIEEEANQIIKRDWHKATWKGPK